MQTKRIAAIAAITGASLLGAILSPANAIAHTSKSKPCVVPRVTGDSLPTARRRIDRAGCRVGRVIRPKVASGRLVVKSETPKPSKRHRRHGTRVRLVLKVKQAKASTVGVTLPTATTPTTTITTAAPNVPAPTVRASVDPDFTQDATDNLRVTWSYSAAAASGALPDGVLSFTVTPATQGLNPVQSCTINVDASTTGGTCTAELPAYGSYQTTVTYTGSGSAVAPSTVTGTDDIEPLPLVLNETWGTDDGTAPTISTVVIGTSSTVTLTDANFEGATSVGITDTTGGSCTATVSGSTASCAMTDTAKPTQYTVSYPGGTTVQSSQSVPPNGTQAVTTNWPAGTVQVDDPSVVVQAATVEQCGGSIPDLSYNESTTSCPNPWPASITVPVGARVYLGASTAGNAAGDPLPLGYVDFSVTGGVEGTDFIESPDSQAASSDCSEMGQDVTVGSTVEGPFAEGDCFLLFETAGTYQVGLSYVSLDANYPSVAGSSETITVTP